MRPHSFTFGMVAMTKQIVLVKTHLNMGLHGHTDLPITD